MLDKDRHASRFMAGLASLNRLVLFDKRGVGLSDSMTDWSRNAQEQWLGCVGLLWVVIGVGVS
jgi:hypothetical protein